MILKLFINLINLSNKFRIIQNYLFWLESGLFFLY